MQEIILSVIVPIYNADPFISRCLDSLICQWPEEDSRYEIICVNDGSTDRSAQILAEYQNKYPSRIKLYRQENQGHAAARNVGLSLAQGEIITFCDADDYLAAGSYYYLFTHFWAKGIDVLKFWSVTLDKKMLKKWHEAPLSGNILFEGYGQDAILSNRLPSFIWTSFYRRQFLQRHNIEFSLIIIGEDDLFNLDVFVRNPRVREVDTYAYYYTTSKTQLTRGREKKYMRASVSGYLQSFDRYLEYSHQYPNLSERLKNKLYRLLLPFISRALCAKMSRQDFLDLKHYLASNKIIPAKGLGLWGLFINFSFQNFFLFRISGFFYKNIFVRFILPHLSRN